MNAVRNAVVLEELAFMAYHAESVHPHRMVWMQQELPEKYHLRKQGKNVFYGYTTK